MPKNAGGPSSILEGNIFFLGVLYQRNERTLLKSLRSIQLVDKERSSEASKGVGRAAPHGYTSTPTFYQQTDTHTESDNDNL